MKPEINLKTIFSNTQHFAVYVRCMPSRCLRRLNMPLILNNCCMHTHNVVVAGGTHQLASLVPRPLPDFISQLWRKIGRRPGTITTSWTGNGGLDSYVMWTRFHNDGNVPTQYADSTASDRTVKAFCQQLRTLQVPSR